MGLFRFQELVFNTVLLVIRGIRNLIVDLTLIRRIVYSAFQELGPVLELTFAVLKIINSLVIKLEVFSLKRDVLCRFTKGVDLNTSAKFSCFLHQFTVLTTLKVITI